MPIPSRVRHDAPRWTLCGDRMSNYVAAPQLVENMLDDIFGGRADRRHMEFRGFGCLVGRVKPGEVFEPSSSRLGIEALGIAPDAFVERGVNKDLDKLGWLGQLADHLPFGPKRRDERA